MKNFLSKMKGSEQDSDLYVYHTKAGPQIKIKIP